jgi:hypothetical protein
MKKFLLGMFIVLMCSIANADVYIGLYSPFYHGPVARRPIIDGVRQNLVRPQYIPAPPTVYIPATPYYYRVTPDLYKYQTIQRPFDNYRPQPSYQYYQIYGGYGVYGVRHFGN